MAEAPIQCILYREGEPIFNFLIERKGKVGTHKMKYEVFGVSNRGVDSKPALSLYSDPRKGILFLMERIFRKIRVADEA